MTKMSATQEASSDPTAAVIASLVPKRHTRTFTALACLGVVVALGGFAVVRSSGVVVPRLRVELQSSAVAATGRVSAVARVFNDGRTSARIDGVDADQVGLSGAAVDTHLPVTVPARAHRDIRMHWAGHRCAAVTHAEAAKFTINARTGLPFSISRGYPVKESDRFVARVDPAPAPDATGDEFTTSGGFGGWVMQVLRFACEYGR